MPRHTLPAALTESRFLGVALVLASAAFYGLSGIFTKTIASDAWTIACWRGFTGAIFVSIYVLWRARGRPKRQSLRLGLGGWLVAVVGALASIAFITSFKMTYVANVTVIYATVPFVAAFLEWIFLRERPQGRMLVAAAVSLVGVAVMMLGGFGGENLLGDAMALLMTAGSALYMVLVRIFRDAPVVWAGAMSAFLLFLAGCLIVDPFAVSPRDAALMVCFGLSFAVAVVLWTEGTRLITAAESGLVGTAEVPLAILFAWVILSEVPPAASMAGGAIVIFAVFAHAIGNFASAASRRRTGSATPAELAK